MRRALLMFLTLLLLGAVAAPAAGYYRQAAATTAQARVAVLPAPVLLTADRPGDTGVEDGGAPAWRVSGAGTALVLERREGDGAWRPAELAVECGPPDPQHNRICSVRPGAQDTKGTSPVVTQERVGASAAYRARAVSGEWESGPSEVVVVPIAPAVPLPTPSSTPGGVR